MFTPSLFSLTILLTPTCPETYQQEVAEFDNNTICLGCDNENQSCNLDFCIDDDTCHPIPDEGEETPRWSKCKIISGWEVCVYGVCTPSHCSFQICVDEKCVFVIWDTPKPTN